MWGGFHDAAQALPALGSPFSSEVGPPQTWLQQEAATGGADTQQPTFNILATERCFWCGAAQDPVMLMRLPMRKWPEQRARLCYS